MAQFHYACLVEAGDVLYEAGNTSLHREVAQIVAQHSTQSDHRRSFLYHNMTVSYLLDMAIVFMTVSDGDTDTRLIFSCLEEIKRKFRDPDRPLHFEETLAGVLKAYNINMDDVENERVQKIRAQMEDTTAVLKETIEGAVPLNELDDLHSSFTPTEINIHQNDHSHPHNPKSGSRVVTAVIICAFVSITLVIALIVWGFETRSRTPPPSNVSSSNIIGQK
jgi:hypothetical protein